MERIHRNERIAVMLKALTDFPGKVLNLGSFTELFGSAKSTISEDIDIINGILGKFDQGVVESIPGATGGIRFIPAISPQGIESILRSLCGELAKKERILPGGFLYMLDIIYNPAIVKNIGRIFASHFCNSGINYIITAETKGIPLAFATAEYLNVPLVIVRHYSEVTDGSSVNINYISGSSKRIQTMALSIKALKKNSRLLFIDDFMKGGGTAKGIAELAREFDCTIAGCGVLIETREPARKLVDNYYSLLTLNSVDEENCTIDIIPNAL